MMTTINHFIQIEGISKTYGTKGACVSALDNLNLNLDAGEFITIMGQSGSGKSTLLSVLGALNRPSSGKIFVDSLDLYRLSSEQRADFRSEYVGFIFQSFQLIPYLTVLENVKLPMAVTGIRNRVKQDMAMEVILRVGLDTKAQRLPDQLSGGEQERVAIARAIVNKPPLILADEPTGNLDSKTAGDIMGLLSDLNREGHTIVVVTHNPEMEAYADRTIRIKDGRFAA